MAKTIFFCKHRYIPKLLMLLRPEQKSMAASTSGTFYEVFTALSGYCEEKTQWILAKALIKRLLRLDVLSRKRSDAKKRRNCKANKTRVRPWHCLNISSCTFQLSF